MNICSKSSHLLDEDVLALEDLDLSVELTDLGLHGGLFLDDLLLVVGDNNSTTSKPEMEGLTTNISNKTCCS